jgi:hypothetical protein
VIAFTAYRGGVGCTTLALSTAAAFVAGTRLPAAAIEFTMGPSSFSTLCAMELPSLYECARGAAAKAGKWRAVTLFPMDYRLARQMPGSELLEYVQQIAGEHVLTVLDAPYDHPLLPHVAERVGRWLVVATPREDALVSALALREHLDESLLILNMAKRADPRLMGVRRNLDIRHHPSAASSLDRRLGKKVLRVIYPHWRRYEQKSGLFGLFR